MLLFHFQLIMAPWQGLCRLIWSEREVMDSCVGGSRACADCKYRARGDIDSVGLLLVITVDGFQWTSLFRIVRASFRGVACFGKRPPCCGNRAQQFLRLLGVVFGSGEHENPVPLWPSMCCTKHMRLLQRPVGCFGSLWA
jgi:hypothetical protein